jgi:hypothetical protein
LKYRYGFIAALLLITLTTQAQILISAIFGDKLNSERIEFGLNGGYNRAYFNDIDGSEGLGLFNIGFYFHIRMFDQSYLSTGVLVKSNTGAGGMPTYPIGDEIFDEVFQEGTLSTKISYFYLPVLFQQRFYKIVLLEGGFQAGLRTKGNDLFDLSAYGGDLKYRREVSDDYARLDFGLLGGMGFKLSKQPKSMSIGVNYYYGLVDVYKSPDQRKRNSSVYIYARIPIGAAPKTE